MSRFMMQVLGKIRPLSFDGGGTTTPLLTSMSTPWTGAPFELHGTRPFEGARDSGPPAGEQSLLVVVDGSMDVGVRDRGREVVYHYRPGSMSFHSSDNRPQLTRVSGKGKIMLVRLTPTWFERLLQDGAPLRLAGHAPFEPDEILRALAVAMCTEVSRGAPTGSLFAESLSLSLLSYALERIPPSQMRVRGALSDGQKRRLKRYIEDRLDQDLRLAELAELCGLRPRHFSTLFRRAFGQTPHRYVIDRRLARGAHLLTNSGHDIAEIALRLGFSSSSHFATEFRRAYGVTPRRYALRQRKIAGS